MKLPKLYKKVRDFQTKHEKNFQKNKAESRKTFQTRPYKNFSMLAVSVLLGTAPITASFFSPLTKIMIVGMLRIPYWVAIEGLSSVFNLKQLSFPAYCFDSSSITGWIIRQGPHHGAQNSTRTGPLALRTSDCHVASVTVGTEILKVKGRGQIQL
jgi:hypothetical protein